MQRQLQGILHFQFQAMKGTGLLAHSSHHEFL
jgi:hypothetical protein